MTTTDKTVEHEPAAQPITTEDVQSSRDWLARAAVPWQLDGGLPAPVRRVIDDLSEGRSIVALGESAHGTHTQAVVKHHLIRHLVEHAGFRTVAWEEGWGSGVAIDRYITTGEGDSASVVADAMFLHRTRAMVDLVSWMREFNIGRPAGDHVRFIGADVIELRPAQMRRLRDYVEHAAPEETPTLEQHLRPVGWRGSPSAQLRWFMSLDPAAQTRTVEHARAVADLVHTVAGNAPTGPAADAVRDAHALQGFYESYTLHGRAENIRERFIAAIIEDWHRDTGDRIVYSAATVHTASAAHVVLSMPKGDSNPTQPPRTFAGGILRDRFGDRYASVAISFDHGEVLTGWEVQPGGPRIYHVPPADAELTDHRLALAPYSAYALSFQATDAGAIPDWLRGPGRLRLIASAYEPGSDAHYNIQVENVADACDAVVHTAEVTACQLLPP